MDKIYLVWTYSGHEDWPELEGLYTSKKSAQKKKQEILDKKQQIINNFERDYYKELRYCDENISSDDWDERWERLCEFEFTNPELNINRVEIEERVVE